MYEITKHKIHKIIVLDSYFPSDIDVRSYNNIRDATLFGSGITIDKKQIFHFNFKCNILIKNCH
jgi:hypothetical protein